MTTLNIHGVLWEINGSIAGKATFTHENIRVVWDPKLGIYQVKSGDEMLLARELRSDALKEATHCILDGYSNKLVPSWECNHGEEAGQAPKAPYRPRVTNRHFCGIRRDT